MVLPVPQAHRVRLDLLAMRQLLQAQPAPPALLVQSQRLPVLLGLLDLKVLAAPQAQLVARVFLAQQDRRALQALAALRDQLELPARLDLLV